MSANVTTPPPLIPYHTAVERLLLDAGIASMELGRWSDRNGEQLAMLVDDEDATAARALVRKIANLSIHFMTSSGGKGGSFRLDSPKHQAITLAVFPYDLAQNLLDKSMRGTGLDALDRFRVAAYVETYFCSLSRLVGLAGGAAFVQLDKLALAAGLDPSLCRDRASLDAYFVSIGWRPSVDKLERLGLADQWIEDNILSDLIGHCDIDPGLSAFFCRARAVELGYLDTMRDALERTGFEILTSIPLGGEVADLIYASTRGGNWGAGPFPTNGGPPVHLLFAVDVFPVAPDMSTLGQHPFLDNDRTLTAKIAARDEVLKTLPPKEHFNPVHSSDNSAEALRIAKEVLPKTGFTTLSENFAARRTDMEAVRGEWDLLEGDNTVAAHVRIDGGSSNRIRKIYRPQYAEHAEQTVHLLTALAPEGPEFPEVLKQGDGYIELDASGGEFVLLSELNRPLPVAAVLRLRDLLRAVAEEGFRPIRWEPRHGIFYDVKKGRLLLPGFGEMIYREERFQLSDLVPAKITSSGNTGSYQEGWFPVLGVPREMFLHRGPILMHLYRWLFFPFNIAFMKLMSVARITKAALPSRAKSLARIVLRRQ